LSLTPYDAAEGLLTIQAQKAVKDMNLQLAGLKSVVEHSGLDANVEIMKYLQSIGVNINAPKAGNFFDQMGAAISKFRDYIFSKSASLYGSNPQTPATGTEGAR
jgi:hypothetical protein